MARWSSFFTIYLKWEVGVRKKHGIINEFENESTLDTESWTIIGGMERGTAR